MQHFRQASEKFEENIYKLSMWPLEKIRVFLKKFYIPFEFFGDLQDLVLHLDYVVRDVLRNPEVLDWALDVEDHGDHTH